MSMLGFAIRQFLVQKESSGVKAEMPATMSLDAALIEVCQLAQKQDRAALDKLVPSLDTVIYTCWAVEILAYSGFPQAVRFLVDFYHGDKSYAIQGYAWGAQFSFTDLKPRPAVCQYLIKGYAKGRHIAEVNQLLYLFEKNEHFALEGYIEAGHVQQLEDALELITFTTSALLKKNLSMHLASQLKGLDAEMLLSQAEQLKSLMKERQVNYSQALAILAGFKLTESIKGVPSRELYNSLGLFREKKKTELSFFQQRVLMLFPKLTVDMMSHWKAHKNEIFSSQHEQTLIYLLDEQKISPVRAIAEINELNACQVIALKELYHLGLRGEALRNMPQALDQQSLDNLLQNCLLHRVELSDALNKVQTKSYKSY